MDKPEDKVESNDRHASDYCINLRVVIFVFFVSLFDHRTKKSHCNIAYVFCSGNPVSSIVPH